VSWAREKGVVNVKKSKGERPSVVEKEKKKSWSASRKVKTAHGYEAGSPLVLLLSPGVSPPPPSPRRSSLFWSKKRLSRPCRPLSAKRGFVFSVKEKDVFPDRHGMNGRCLLSFIHGVR